MSNYETHHQINIGEDLPLTSKQSKLSNTKHTKGKYHHKLDCSYCNESCVCNPIVTLIFITIILIIPSAIVIGGYYTVAQGMKKNDYANTFNIKGSCTITYADVIYVQKTCTRTYQQCSRRRLYGSGSGSGSYGSNNKKKQQTCVTKTETYDCSYYYTSVDYKVNTETNSTIFPCDIGTEFNERYNGRHYEYKKGEKRACYTNSNCAEIFASKNNRHHESAGWIYFGASVVFLVAICCLGCIGYVCRKKLRNMVGKCCDSSDDCCTGVCCLCVEYKGYKGKKNGYYKYQWDNVMNDDDRFDYVMSNWMKKYGKYKYKYTGIHDAGISVDIESIIYDYLCFSFHERA
eukprot:479933_1